MKREFQQARVDEEKRTKELLEKLQELREQHERDNEQLGEQLEQAVEKLHQKEEDETPGWQLKHPPTI